MMPFKLPLLLAALACPCFGQAQDPFGQDEEPAREACFAGDDTVDLKSLHGKPIKRLVLLACDNITDISAVVGMKLEDVMLWKVDVNDISPLTGMPIRKLILFGCPVEDLTPLKGMPLKSLWIGATNATDFSPLKGLPLTDLSLYASEVSDLSPLEGMPLERLNIQVVGSGKITDLTPLEGMRLKQLSFDPDTVTSGMDVIRAMKSLKEINGIPARSFWRNYAMNEVEKGNKTE